MAQDNPPRPSSSGASRTISKMRQAAAGHNELKRLIHASEQRRLFVRCGDANRKDKLSRMINSIPSTARLPRDLYTSLNPRQALVSWYERPNTVAGNVLDNTETQRAISAAASQDESTKPGLSIAIENLLDPFTPTESLGESPGKMPMNSLAKSDYDRLEQRKLEAVARQERQTQRRQQRLRKSQDTICLDVATRSSERASSALYRFGRISNLPTIHVNPSVTDIRIQRAVSVTGGEEDDFSAQLPQQTYSFSNKAGEAPGISLEVGSKVAQRDENKSAARRKNRRRSLTMSSIAPGELDEVAVLSGKIPEDVAAESRRRTTSLRAAQREYLRSRGLLSAQLQQELGRFVYEMPSRYSAKFASLNAPTGPAAGLGLEGMRLQAELEQAQRRLASHRVYEAVISAVPMNKRELGPIDRILLRVLRRSLHRGVIITRTNIFLLLQQINFEVVRAVHKYSGVTTNDDVVDTTLQTDRAAALPQPKETSSNDTYLKSHPSHTPAVLGLTLDTNIMDTDVALSGAGLGEELDTEQAYGEPFLREQVHVTLVDEDALTWPTVLAHPINVLLSCLNISSSDYANWLSRQGLKLPESLDDRLDTNT